MSSWLCPLSMSQLDAFSSPFCWHWHTHGMGPIGSFPSLEPFCNQSVIEHRTTVTEDREAAEKRQARTILTTTHPSQTTKESCNVITVAPRLRGNTKKGHESLHTECYRQYSISSMRGQVTYLSLFCILPQVVGHLAHPLCSCSFSKLKIHSQKMVSDVTTGASLNGQAVSQDA